MKRRARRSTAVLEERLEELGRVRRQASSGMKGELLPAAHERELAPLPAANSSSRPGGQGNSAKKSLQARMANKVLVVENAYPIDEKPRKMSVEAFYRDQLEHCPPSNTHDMGLLHWSLARVYHQRALQAQRGNEALSTSIEHALEHLFESKKIFTRDTHPIMHGVLQLMTLQLYIQRLLNDVENSISDAFILHALDLGEDAYSIFKQYQRQVEIALSCIYIAWLYVISIADDNDIPSQSSKSEQSITYLLKALSILEMNSEKKTNDLIKESCLPLLLQDKSLSYFEGICYFLLGNLTSSSVNIF